MLGGSCSSQRWQALPLVAMAASGWLISCAIDAVSSPRLWMRAMRASWVRASNAASSAAARLSAR
ncbi:hypothetical protein WJ972_31910 [Achromobacter insuavis]